MNQNRKINQFMHLTLTAFLASGPLLISNFLPSYAQTYEPTIPESAQVITIDENLVINGLDMQNPLKTSPDEFQNTINEQTSIDFNYDTLSTAEKAVWFCRNHAGDTYSMDNRDSKTEFDCSSLLYWAYQFSGIDIDAEGFHTAAEIAKRGTEQGNVVTNGKLAIGDMVFFSYKENGRYLNISHTAMISENGMMIEASSSNGAVIERAAHFENAEVIIRVDANAPLTDMDYPYSQVHVVNYTQNSQLSNDTLPETDVLEKESATETTSDSEHQFPIAGTW